MSEPYKPFEPKLKFFGTMNGASKSHTNAFFCPDDETIVFLDMSLLNAYEAERVIRTKPGLKHFYLCLTHNHFDHASGVGKLAFDVKSYFPGSTLTVIVDEIIREETLMRLDNEGLRPKNGCLRFEDKVYDLISFDMYGFAWTFRYEDGTVYNRLAKPDWFIRTIPTEHSPRLNGASGFALNDNGTLIVYSGDTNRLEPCMSFLRTALDDDSDRGDPPIEFYLDIATRKTNLHLNFERIVNELRVMLDEYTTMKLIFMHYDDPVELKQRIDELLPSSERWPVYIAKTSL